MRRSVENYCQCDPRQKARCKKCYRRVTRQVAKLRANGGIPGGNLERLRLPMEPLETRVRLYCQARGVEIQEVARRAGIGPEYFHRVMWRPTISGVFGDRVACALGLHPYEVWGEEFYAGLEEEVA